MIEELNDAITDYNAKWKSLVEMRRDRQFFADLHPTAVAWKTVDRTEYDKIFAELHELADLVTENWWDGRWIAMVHLREIKLTSDIEVVKLMQRRPNSKDATGIDHVDFYHPNVAKADDILIGEPNLNWSHETGGLTKWTSVWFAGTEAKLRTHTIIDSCIRDLTAANERIKKR